MKGEGAVFEARDLRYAFGRFATGVTIVTYATDDGPRGFTANSFTSVSLDPPLLLISVDRRIKAARYLPERPFAVNVLKADQAPLADHFAGRGKEANLSVPWKDGVWAPHFDEALAIFECTPWRTYDGGDHLLVLGLIRRYTYGGDHALTFFCGQYGIAAHQAV
ncbi:MAG: flavin reductase family protein [Hydrogenibacillus schlegelii]|uniref:Flavin reductase family protein n=1 Tax=Hydrogenibacillus schlegelii TaxID=1484 RepID=A0A947CVZ9_HYDSH|nr:flavin reductase family protein [Hydrogenibacillus schlegelii]